MIYLWQTWVFILVIIIIDLVLLELLTNWLERKAFLVKFIRKVYCKNCRCWDEGYRACQVLDFFPKEKTRNHIGEVIETTIRLDNFSEKCQEREVFSDTHLPYYHRLNINFNCEYYKRKWYKFWVK